MKEIIISLGLIFLFLYSMMLDWDVDGYKSQRKILKGVAEETAASAAQYFKADSFGEGYYNFVTTTGTQAANTTLRKTLRLDASNRPLKNAYWEEQVTMQLTFIDYSTAATYLHPTKKITGQTFPNYFTFTHFGKKEEVYLSGPSVISSINTGKPNYALAFFDSLAVNVIESGIHTMKE